MGGREADSDNGPKPLSNQGKACQVSDIKRDMVGFEASFGSTSS